MNESLFEFFAAHYGRARVALVGESNLVGKAIRQAQKSLTPDRAMSRWSHVFILGAKPLLYESDIAVKQGNAKTPNGAQESPIRKWCGDDIEHAAVLDFGLTAAEQDAVLKTARRLCDEQMKYPLGALVATWAAIVTQRTWKENPKHNPHAMYCSSFVRYCFQEAGRDFLGSKIALSHTAPEHIGQSRPFLAEWRS